MKTKPFLSKRSSKSFFNVILLSLFVQLNTFKSEAQHNNYFELNGGIAFTDDIPVAPGASFLFGHTHRFENRLLLDAEVGIAFPSIGTAKLGVGYAGKKMDFIVGVRPFPLFVSAQTNIRTEKGAWVFSAEVSPVSLTSNRMLSIGTHGILTFGYRWNLGQKD